MWYLWRLASLEQFIRDMKMRWKCSLWSDGPKGRAKCTLRWGRRWNAGVRSSPHNQRAMIFWDMGLSVRSNREDLWAVLHLNVHLSWLSQKLETGVGGRENPLEVIVMDPDVPFGLFLQEFQQTKGDNLICYWGNTLCAGPCNKNQLKGDETAISPYWILLTLLYCMLIRLSV